MCRKLFFLISLILALGLVAETANAAVANQNGVDFEYFEGEFQYVSDFNDLTPVRTGVRDNFEISPFWRDDYWGFRFTGYIDLPEDANYTFYTLSDDGSQLWIGDTLVVDNDGVHGMKWEEGSIVLNAGMHPITVTFFEHTGGETLEVCYEWPGTTKTEIPDEVLYRTSYIAFDPDPNDGAVGVASDADLSWSPGVDAADANGHDVYFGTTSPPLFIRNQDVNSYDPGTMDNGETYYWRINEVNDACEWEGEVWSFTVIPVKAWNPSPANDVKYVPIDADLSWSAGEGATSHDVYFGTTLPIDPCSSGQPGTAFEPGILEYDTEYFWRIDEKNGGTITGNVWSFTTVSDVIEDAHLIGHWKLDEGGGMTAYDASGHGNNGTLEGDPAWVAGQVDGALELDGDGDYVSIANESNLDITGTITVAAWIKVDEFNRCFQLIIAKGHDTWRLQRHRFENYPEFACSIDEECECVVGSANVNDGKWHHVTGVYDGSKLCLYVDGLLDACIDASGSMDTTDDPVRIGAIMGQGEIEREWDGLIDDVRVYDRALSYIEIRVLAGCNMALAWNPSPADGAEDELPDVDLSWQPGIYADEHDVYFGDDWDDVNDANTSDSTGIYRGRQEPSSYPLEFLEFGKPYYWRIDEVNDACTPYLWKGDVWSFSVANYLLVDDFESYASGSELRGVWPEDNWNTTITLATDPSHGGEQSMRFVYSNSWGDYYSQTTRTFSPTEDWTVGVKALDLWFYGSGDNDANGQMYVKLEDGDNPSGSKKVSYEGPVSYLRNEWWHAWRIDLQDFTNVNLANIKKLSIGVSHESDPPSHPAGGGTVYFDDIELYPSRCITEYVAADFTGDCMIGLEDLDIFTRHWLADKPSGMVNGSFSAGLDDWTWWCNYTTGDTGLTVDPSAGGALHEMASECSTSTNFGLYQVIDVIPGEDYTIDANWSGDVSGDCEATGGWTEVLMFCADDPYDEEDIIARMEPTYCEGWKNIVAKHECESFTTESITEAMAGEFPGKIGTNTIMAVTPYIVIATKLGGLDCGHEMSIDDIELTGPWPCNPADFNTDEAVNFKDFAEMADMWLEGPILWP